MIYAPDYQASCYWQDDVALPPSDPAPLPPVVDTLIIGSGYTGLAAARETAAGGRRTLVLDAGAVAGGCSSRNGGQVAFSIKPDHATLVGLHGRAVADGIYAEALEANADLAALAGQAGVAMDYRPNGGFIGAHTRRHQAALVRAFESQVPAYAEPFEVVGPAQRADFVDSPLYHGGVYVPSDASVHPGRLAAALHARAVAAGAQVRGHCAVTALQRDGAGFLAQTAAGPVRAAQVLVATNGYTGAALPWHRRRVFPVGSYIIATEALDPARVRELIPRASNVCDTRRVVVYVRPSPDGRRILFGGRASAGETDVTRCVPRLHAMMAEMFPALASVAVSRAWMGFVGFTFDTRPHLGCVDGVYYSLGYCGQGVPLATYYGRHIGRRMVDPATPASALEGLPFPTRPFYRHRPWFLPLAVQYYRLLDTLGW